MDLVEKRSPDRWEPRLRPFCEWKESHRPAMDLVERTSPDHQEPLVPSYLARVVEKRGNTWRKPGSGQI